MFLAASVIGRRIIHRQRRAFRKQCEIAKARYPPSRWKVIVRVEHDSVGAELFHDRQCQRGRLCGRSFALAALDFDIFLNLLAVMACEIAPHCFALRLDATPAMTHRKWLLAPSP